MKRRLFIKTAAAVGLVGPATVVGQSSGQDSLPIVDTHQHLWDRQRFRIEWLKNAPAILNRDYSTRDYLEAVQGLNVRQAVYLEVDVADEQQAEEARYIEKLAASSEHPTSAAVISGRCDLPGFRDYITPFSHSRYIKGVRHIVQGLPRKFCLQPQFVKSVQLLGELGMSFDLTIGPGGLDDAVQLCRKCPDTLIVVDHCGGADPKAFMPKYKSQSRFSADAWKKGMAALAEAKHTVCKISGIVARVPEKWSSIDLAPIVNHCLNVFGPDRVMFGGDWPVCLRGAGLREWVTALKEIVQNRPLAEQRKLFAENAIRHYRLKEK